MGKLEKRFPIYSRLLKLYPNPYQKQYKRQTLQTLEDMLSDTPNLISRISIWARAAVDFPISVTKQQLQYASGIMREETPSYVKRNAAIGGLLLAPFFISVLSGILQNQLFMSSHSWIVFFTVVIIGLPALAFVLNALTYLKWSVERSHQAKTSFWQNLLDLHHNWLMLITAGLGLFIVALVFGHDSVHCLTGNPYSKLHNWYQTWQCIQLG